MYNHGMKVLFYSKKREQATGIGWYRDGKDICYYQNAKGNQYTLSFNFGVEHDEDEIYLAHWYPYTYTDCKNLVKEICCPATREIARRTELCKSLA